MCRIFGLASRKYFNPRSPCGERRPVCGHWVLAAPFQSTLPVWGATTVQFLVRLPHPISIHAPRVGSDLLRHVDIYPVSGISIHAPRVGSDKLHDLTAACLYGFQSTLPVWGATAKTIINANETVFQSTLPVWGATIVGIPSAQCDQGFQSTLPVWGATLSTFSILISLFSISIHAPRVGSDQVCQSLFLTRYYFNPRSPCGERLTLPPSRRLWKGYFNPRSPCGERQ